MNDEKLISIIVPAYNSENTLERCIQSVLHQSIKKFVLYIINDGSTDNTINILMKYKNYPNIKIISKDNEGVSSARNLGLKLVNTKFVTFIDSDDYVEKNFLKHLLNGMINETIDMSIIGFKTIYKNKIIDSNNYKTGIFSSKEGLAKILEQKGPQGYLWNKLFKVQLIKNNSLLFDNKINMSEDLLFCVQYLLVSKNIYITNTMDYNYIQNENSLSQKTSLNSTNSSYEQAYIDFIRVLKKIENNIPINYHDAKINSRARVGKASSDLLRAMILNESSNKELYKEIRLNAEKNQKYVYKSSIVDFKRKIYYFLTLYFPYIVYKLDGYKFK